jgi:hypothetical protein
MEVSQFEASPAKKLTSPYLKTSQVRWFMPMVLAWRHEGRSIEAEVGRLLVQGSPSKKCKILSG